MYFTLQHTPEDKMTVKNRPPELALTWQGDLCDKEK